MRPEELFQTALTRARQRGREGHLGGLQVEALREEAVRFFREVPEPPVYRRPQDPLREAAAQALPRATELLVSVWAHLHAGPGQPLETSLAQALERHVEALCHAADGRLLDAERSYHRALRQEAAFRSARRAWVRLDQLPRPVFDRTSGVSRYDPRPDPIIQVSLVCPSGDCRAENAFACSPSTPRQHLRCPRCLSPFLAFLGEVREARVEAAPRSRRYLLKLDEVGGGHARLEFEDASGETLALQAGDLLALLYTHLRELRGVLNLASGRALWVREPGACFLATVAFGEGAPELVAFRSFRDDVLLRSRTGRWMVAAYYARGPGWAALVRRHPRMRFALQAVLTLVHARLEPRYGASRGGLDA